MCRKIVSGALIFLYLSIFLLPFHANSDDAGSAQCRTFFTRYGNYFDDYEHVNYVGGFLNMHFRLSVPLLNNFGWRQTILLDPVNCLLEKGYDVPVDYPDMHLPLGLTDFSVRFTSLTHYDIWDDSAEAPINCDGCSVDIPATLPNGDPYNAVSYTAHFGDYASLMASGSYPIRGSPAPPKEPVIIIPGILGTEMTIGDDKVWPNLPKMVLDPADKFMDDLALDSNGVPKNSAVNPGDVLGDINYVFGDFDYSTSLIKNLQSDGYAIGQNLFIFSYDWRLSVQDNSARLKDYLSTVLKQTGAAKINFLAHSLGGLILKQYLETGDVAATVDNVIFAGVPNLGTPLAAKILLFGDNLSIPLISSDELQKLSHDMPSIYDLLPSQDYYKVMPGFYDDLTNNSKGILNYPESKNLLLDNGENAALITAAEQLHTDAFDNFDFSTQPYHVYNFISCGNYTVKTISKMYQGTPTFGQKITRDTKYRIYADSGDGTVILGSAEHLKVAPNQRYFFRGIDHAHILSNPDVQSGIISIFDGSPNLSAPQVPDKCPLEGKLISLPSDLELTVTDGQGSPLDPTALTKNQIGAQEFVYLPTDSGQQYQVSAKASAAKKADLEIDDYHDDKKVQDSYNNINLKDSGNLNIKLDNAKINVYSSDPSSGQDQQIVPDQTSTTSAADPGTDNNTGLSNDDLTAPATQIYRYSDNSLPVNGVIKLSNDNRKVTFTAIDDKSGVSQTLYSFNGGQDWHPYDSKTPLLVPPDQGEILFYSVDQAGNQEEIQSTDFDWDTQTSAPEVVVNNQAPSALSNSDPTDSGSADSGSSDTASDDSGSNPDTEDASPDLSTARVLSASTAAGTPITVIVNIPDNLVNTGRAQSADIYERVIKVEENPYLFLWNKLSSGIKFLWNLINI